MLDEWLQAAVGEAGLDPSLLGGEAVEALLDLAREAAHGVARPAAPLATFAVGLALGRAGAGAGIETLRAEVARIMAVAAVWEPPAGN